MNHLTKDITELCEKIINRYKKEQKNKKKENLDKQKSLKNKKILNLNTTDSNINKQIHLFSVSNDVALTTNNISKEKRPKLIKSNNKDYIKDHQTHASQI
jgi:hypothetical protein